ncbi:MAG TPA: hypothetical protein DEH78_24455 [Solibacterales bacterium]|nr:hypothetical protein [Bryobacterales bacterium]
MSVPGWGSDLRELVIVGAGGHGREIASYLQDGVAERARLRLLGFIDEALTPGWVNGLEVLGGLDRLVDLAAARPAEEPLLYIVAVGGSSDRRRLVARLSQCAPRLAPWTLRHGSAVVGAEVEIGEGTCLAPMSIVTTRVRIGRHSILNVRASVSHDCVVGEFVDLNPGAVVCGQVNIGDGCYIGAGATVIDHITIGPGTIVGAGAVVTRDLPGGVTAVGVPARIIKHHQV